MKKIGLLMMGNLLVLSACTPNTNPPTPQANSPIQAVLIDQPNLLNNASNLSISQQMNALDDASNAQVTILQTVPSEDAISKTRTEYLLKRDQTIWKIVNKKQSYQCTKGQETTDFQVNPCP
ncbi:hypothetical protein I6L25_17440 [Acinetobacter nosocomialis]|uniref:hypothetical protein n=1 Tax=Acinetobacter nosocomialis TaxID=106654 RepID=UPI0002CEBD73|nr:hypothetical protein [Acinetobacter nosocomialis]ENU46081.1 hypothetical protein F984_03239 [Acinetobacter nosocomialis NIPH 2119]QXC12136.1 hypothetical protein I6L25_17440 [Acinetobacter nosocomialis]